MGNMLIGYDSKQTIIMFYNTMIAKAPLTVDFSNEYVPVKGHIINGELDISGSYLNDHDISSLHWKSYTAILAMYPDEDKMDVYQKTKDLQSRVKKIINDAVDNVEVYIEEIDFTFTKNVDVDLETLKEMCKCIYK